MRSRPVVKRDDPRAAARLRRGPGRPGERRVDDARSASRTSTAPRSSAQLDAVAPEFTAGADAFGQLRPSVLRAWAAWDLKFGILHKPLDVRHAFDTTLVEKPRKND